MKGEFGEENDGDKSFDVMRGFPGGGCVYSKT